MLKRMLRRLAAVLIAPVLVAGTLPAQNIDFTKGKSHLPFLFAPYTPRSVPQPQLMNSPRIEQLIREGKLYLSLQDGIYLALENNLDIVAARYGPDIAETDFLRAKGSPVVGGVGGGINQVGSTFLDPRFSTSLSIQRSYFPINNPFLTGTGVLAPRFNQDVSRTDFSYSQGFDIGTAFRVGWANRRAVNNPSGNLFNPSYTSGLYFGVSQPLLNGFGRTQNARAIRVAKNSKEISDHTFLQQVMDIISNVKNAYWELVFAREDVKVKEQSLALAEKLYQDNKRQVEIGTLAPIEVVRAESEVARTRQDLIVSQTSLLQQQIALKDLIAKNPMDPLLALVEIVPTDTVEVPEAPEVIPIQDAIQIAMEKRPEIISAQLDLKNRDLDRKAARQALLPGMELYAFYGGNGLAGLAPPLPEDSGAARAITRAWQGIWDGDFRDYGFGLNISLPIKNRVAQAESARAQIAQRQSETRYRRTINSMIVEVRNAQITLEQSRARIEAAEKSRRLFQETLDAEQKKFQLGASTIFQVIQAQRDLAAASSTEVRAGVDFKRAQVAFDRALGRTLDRSNVTVDEALTGVVTGTTPKTEVRP